MPAQRTLNLLPACWAALLLFGVATAAEAQLLDSVKSALGAGSSTSASSAGGASMAGGLGGALGGSLGGQSLPSLSSVGTGNITGVLTYCAKNKYLGGDASSVQNKLLGQLGGAKSAQSDAGYQQGIKGILGGESGQKVDLGGGGGLKQQITDKVCDQVLQYGKSLL